LLAYGFLRVRLRNGNYRQYLEVYGTTVSTDLHYCTHRAVDCSLMVLDRKQEALKARHTWSIWRSEYSYSMITKARVCARKRQYLRFRMMYYPNESTNRPQVNWRFIAAARSSAGAIVRQISPR